MIYNIIDLIANDGYQRYRKVSSTRGGEWAGPCPSCGGKDRFRVQPFHNPDKGGYYWCRQCNIHGDAIQYLRDFYGKSYSEACRLLNIVPAKTRNNKTVKHKWIPKDVVLTGKPWREKAKQVLKEMIDSLWHDFLSQVAYLQSRGLEGDTIKKSFLGYNHTTRYFPPEEWGFSPWINEKGNFGRVIVPKGIIIPLFNIEGEILRLRVRTDEQDHQEMGYPPYMLVKGSATIPFIIGNIVQSTSYIVVESELDALLIHQEAGALVTVVALGSVTNRPDKIVDFLLKKASKILVALDTDSAGIKESWTWWLEHYKNAVRLPIPVKYGKDPTEALRNGLDLKTWVVVGTEV